MKVRRGLVAVVVAATAATAAAGDIQVLAEPGLRVYLDDELVGITGRLDDGFYLMGVAQGAHVLRVEKDGCAPQRFELEVGEMPLEVVVGEFALLPAAPPAEAGPGAASEPGRPAGSLDLSSAPQNCVVEIDGRPHTKTSPVLTVGGLGAGEHTVVFRKPGYEPLRRTVSIPPGATLAVHGNLKQRTVDVEHPGVGSLRLRCRPTSCTVRLLGMLRDTSGGSLKLSHLPAGEHRLVVAIPGRELQTSILILDGQRTEVEASFLKGEEPFRVTHVPR
jgi:hypothetical protein